MMTFAPGDPRADQTLAQLRDLERVLAIVELYTRPDGKVHPEDLSPEVRGEAQALLDRADGLDPQRREARKGILLDYARIETVLRGILDAGAVTEVDGKPYPTPEILAYARQVLADLEAARARLLGQD